MLQVTLGEVDCRRVRRDMYAWVSDVVSLATAVAHKLCNFYLSDVVTRRNREQLWNQHPEPVPVLVGMLLFGVETIPVENWIFVDISLHLL